MKPIPPELIQALDYEPSTGVLKWKRNGKQAGTVLADGYVAVRFKGQAYKAHRIAWAIHTGDDPGDFTVEHKDRNKSNNSIENLMLLVGEHQNFNQGSLGYHWVPQINSFRITFGGNYVGVSQCPLLARIRYYDQLTEFLPNMSVPFLPACPIKGNPQVKIDIR